MSEGLVAFVNGDAMKREFKKVLNSDAMVSRFLRLATSTINMTPRLRDCSQESVIGALLKSAQLNLEPNTVLGECYLIPRQNKGRWEANFELGYKGLMKLAYRSGDVKIIQAYEVYDADRFDVDYGENKIIHKPLMTGNRGEVYAYWARYTLKDGTSDFKVWTKSEIEQHRNQYSKSASSDFSPWNTAFDQMAKKTVIKDVLKYAPMSVEDYAHAIAADQNILEANVKGDEGISTGELFRMGSREEEKPLIAAAEKNGEWQKAFDSLQAKIAERISDGTPPAEIESQMGMSFNDAESATVEKLKQALKDTSLIKKTGK